MNVAVVELAFPQSSVAVNVTDAKPVAPQSSDTVSYTHLTLPTNREM